MNVVTIGELKYQKYAKVVGDLSLNEDKVINEGKKTFTKDEYIQAYIRLLTNSIK